MERLKDRLTGWQGEMVVLDFKSPFVAVGRLSAVGDDFLELLEADLHDLRDTTTTRENYVVKTARVGVAQNRRTVLVRVDDVVAIAKLDDVVTG